MNFNFNFYAGTPAASGGRGYRSAAAAYKRTSIERTRSGLVTSTRLRWA